MPSRNPRLNLVLRPELRHLVDRVATAQHKSRNRVVMDLLEEFAPVLERVVVVLEAADKAKASATGEAERRLRETVEKASPVIEAHASAAMDQFDWLLQQATHAQGRAAGGKDVRKRSDRASAPRGTRKAEGKRLKRPTKARTARKRGKR